MPSRCPAIFSRLYSRYTTSGDNHRILGTYPSCSPTASSCAISPSVYIYIYILHRRRSYSKKSSAMSSSSSSSYS